MTPLFKKLNLGANQEILVLRAPEAFDAEVALLSGVTVRRKRGTRTGAFAIGFAVTLDDLEQVSRELLAYAEGDAALWVAYPKGTSKKYKCEFNRDTSWTAFGDAGYEPVRQVAIDADWSALRFRKAEHVQKLTRRNSMAISAEGKRRTQS